MSKLFLTLFLTAAFSWTTFAADQSSQDQDGRVTHYKCWAKDYENLWFPGWSARSQSDAQWDSMKNCRRGSLAPETCRVIECKSWKDQDQDQDKPGQDQDQNKPGQDQDQNKPGQDQDKPGQGQNDQDDQDAMN